MKSLIQLGLFASIWMIQTYGGKTPVSVDICYAALDIIQVQDATSSFDSFHKVMVQHVDSVVKSIKDTHSESRFGLVTFLDKNLSSDEKRSHYTIGFEDDYCARVALPLSSPDPEVIQKAFDNCFTALDQGGGDWQENSFGAIYRALASSEIGLRDVTESDTSVQKLIVLVTDALSHKAGDVLYYLNKKLSPFSVSNPLKDINEGCDSMEYPSLQQVAELVKKNNAHLIVLAAPGGDKDSNGNFNVNPVLSLEGKKYQTEEGLALWYQDQFAKAGLNDVVVATLDPEMKSYAHVFQEALNEYRYIHCPEGSIEASKEEIIFENPLQANFEALMDINGGDTQTERSSRGKRQIGNRGGYQQNQQNSQTANSPSRIPSVNNGHPNSQVNSPELPAQITGSTNSFYKPGVDSKKFRLDGTRGKAVVDWPNSVSGGNDHTLVCPNDKDVSRSREGDGKCCVTEIVVEFMAE